MPSGSEQRIDGVAGECVRVIREALPRAFMLENVPGLVSMAKGAIIKQVCEDLAACGYDVSWEILNAADYGVPQNRKRVILVGTRNDAMTFYPRPRNVSACTWARLSARSLIRASSPQNTASCSSKSYSLETDIILMFA